MAYKGTCGVLQPHLGDRARRDGAGRVDARGRCATIPAARRRGVAGPFRPQATGGARGMVLYVLKWDILPESREEYHRWIMPAIERSLAVPGVVECRAYETVAGPHRKVVTYEF